MSSATTPAMRDWWVVFGMTITALSAAISSFSGLQSLAAATGWPGPLSPLLPFTVDAYAMTATRVWLSGATRSRRARNFARWNAIMAIGLSLVGNAVWHLIAAEVLIPSWPIVVLVGAVPPAVLGLLSHLAVLRGQVDAVPVTSSRTAEPTGTPQLTVPPSSAVAHPRSPEDEHQDDDRTAREQPQVEPSSTLIAPNIEDELLKAARAADAAHRAEHGKPITRDELRKVLRVGTEKATVLRRQLKESISKNRG